MTVSSAMARKTGFARAMAAPPLPSTPWHPAQFCPYRRLKSTTSLGGSISKSDRGMLGDLLQATQARSATIAAIVRATRMARRFIADDFLRPSRPSLPVLQSRRGLRKEGIAKYVPDVVWKRWG